MNQKGSVGVALFGFMLVAVGCSNLVAGAAPEGAANVTGIVEDPSELAGGVQFYFRDIEISQLARIVSDFTQRKIILNDQVRAKVTVFAPCPMSAGQVFRMFADLMESRGLVLVPMSGDPSTLEIKPSGRKGEAASARGTSIFAPCAMSPEDVSKLLAILSEPVGIEEGPRESPSPPAAYVPPPDAIRRIDEWTYRVDAAEVPKALQHLDFLFTQVRGVPNFSEGKVDGFRLFSIQKGSIFDKLGLLNGDVIKKVNENEMDSSEMWLDVVEDLKTPRDLSVEVVRQGRSQAILYQVRP